MEPWSLMHTDPGRPASQPCPEASKVGLLLHGDPQHSKIKHTDGETSVTHAPSTSLQAPSQQAHSCRLLISLWALPPQGNGISATPGRTEEAQQLKANSPRSDRHLSFHTQGSWAPFDQSLRVSAPARPVLSEILTMGSGVTPRGCPLV